MNRRRAAALAAIAAATLAGTAGATHLAIDTDGHTTVDQTIVAAESPRAGYTNLKLGPGEPYALRDAREDSRIPAAQEGRDARRVSLAYMSQLTDFQLADEESPARVEFVDPGPASAWRPQEGFTPFQIEATIRQINRFAAASPIPQGDGSRNTMDFALLTGDQADNQHLNETVWVRDLLEGTGPTSFNSGLSKATDYSSPATLGAGCAAYVAQEGGAAGAAAEGARYTGVQDYDDYPVGEPVNPLYYDPDDPQGPTWLDWPEYDGLMDRAQQLAIDPEGLRVPFYITNGNHDVLVQGNEDANRAFEDIATGCFKALGTTNDPTKQPPPPDGPDPNYLLSPADVGMLVAPDPGRQFVSKPQIKDIYGASDEGAGDDDHGFSHVAPEENAESRGSASYYAWDPEQTPGFRFISIDTNSEGGQTAESFVPGQPSTPGSSNGNLDDPQFQWLKRELQKAKARNQLVVIFGHHPVRSMNTQIRDEQAAPCSGSNDNHGHDVNPGCDVDPRPSDDDLDTPGYGCIHNGTDAQNTTCPQGHESFVELIDKFPNVTAFVPGHTHEHRLTPFVRTDGTTWWEVNTSAVIDYPNQSRLVELMDNRDGTLSIFNTVVDHSAPATAPADCPDGAQPAPDCAAAFTEPELASIGRTFTFNDPDNDFTGDGRSIDRNAELLLEDPRPVTDLALAKVDSPDPVVAGEPLTYTVTASNSGAGESQDTTVVDDLPAGVTVRDVAPSQGSCDEAGGQVECNLGPVAAGGQATVAITVVPNSRGRIANSARVRGNVADRNSANDVATSATTVIARPAPTPTASPSPMPTPTIVPGPAPIAPPRTQRPGPSAGAEPRPAARCTAAAAPAEVAARPRGRRVAMSVRRRPGAGRVQVDVFQSSAGRRTTGERLVARFAPRTGSFVWSGRANRRGHTVRDGIHFVRFRTRGADGRIDVRRRTLRRVRGRWSARPSFEARGSCGLIANFKLERPAFGGRSQRPLGISYELDQPSRVRLEVLRGRRVVERLTDSSRRAGTLFRSRIGREMRRRGDYRIRLTAQRGATRETRVLVARKL